MMPFKLKRALSQSSSETAAGGFLFKLQPRERERWEGIQIQNRAKEMMEGLKFPLL